jgi:ABC-type lipoprotein export system ATPase subunit
LLRRLNSEEQTTFIIASHDHSLIDGADRVIKIVDGLVAS